jgi:hypothetical protein
LKGKRKKRKRLWALIPLVTEPMLCYEFRKENGKKEERLRRKEWIFIEEMAYSRRLLFYLAFEVPRTSKFLQNRIQSE